MCIRFFICWLVSQCALGFLIVNSFPDVHWVFICWLVSWCALGFPFFSSSPLLFVKQFPIKFQPCNWSLSFFIISELIGLEFQETQCSPIQRNYIHLLGGHWEVEISHKMFKYLSIVIQAFSTAMSNTLITNTEVLASTLLTPIFSQSLAATGHTPRKRVFQTAEEQIPKKRCLLVSNVHINTVLASFCSCKKCLDNFSFADILNITQPFADLNERDHTTFIIIIMSASCVSTLPECHFKLWLNGSPVCLNAFQKVPTLFIPGSQLFLHLTLLLWKAHGSAGRSGVLLNRYSFLVGVSQYTTPLDNNGPQMLPPIPTYG